VTARRPPDDDPGSGVAPRSWPERLADPAEPLYTSAVTAELLGIDSQALRRLEHAAGITSERPSGNQRRYSRNDIETLSRAADLANAGTQGRAIGHILELEQQLAEQVDRNARRPRRPAR
jgi:DNA-binding transcriptional MerR regulator